ncbi:MAG TPA: lipoate--protein ligase, partial [Porphyromonadaceae bacterium]|nr:lipoate--protein ligase [Porphyromonadaceae bacterium]
QEDLFEQLIREKLQKKEDKQHFLLFCEHEHVYTLGKSGDSRNLLIT